jgi:uncharacterized RDD family membrane protein YckC
VDPARWYSYEAGRQLGPVDWSALKARAENGLLGRDDFVWREGTPDWVSRGERGGFVPSDSTCAAARVAAPTADRGDPARGARARSLRRLLAARRRVRDRLRRAVRRIFVFFFFGGFLFAMAGRKAESIGGAANIVAVLSFWICFAGLESSRRQATLGKLALGIRVTDLAGRRVDFARASGRHFAKVLSSLCLLVGFVMAAFTRRKQTLHDIVAGCLVVRGRSSATDVPEHEAWARKHWGEPPRLPEDVERV